MISNVPMSFFVAVPCHVTLSQRDTVPILSNAMLTTFLYPPPILVIVAALKQTKTKVNHMCTTMFRTPSNTYVCASYAFCASLGTTEVP